MSGQFIIAWVDHGREPRCKPNPAYPDGTDVAPEGATDMNSCQTDLPYPAPRCGVHEVHCSICGTTVVITAAGRRDDPRSARIPCEVVKRRVQ